jgi:uncharacterized protein YndB with AHSA1/START domain
MTMTAPSVHKDPESMTMTISMELDATVERAWQLWADPRQLEQWWAPPSHPMTMVEFDLTPGGRLTHYFTGEDGEKHHGVWAVIAADPPTRLELADADTDAEGVPNDGNAMTNMVVTLTERKGNRTLMAVELHFVSVEGMEQVAAAGMEDGMVDAMGRVEAILSGG